MEYKKAVDGRKKSRKPILQRMLVTGSEEEGGTRQECDSPGN